MKLTNFENLKDLTQGISENTQGELSTHLGNNVYSPLDDGLGMYNKAVTRFDTYRDNTVSMNEAVEYVYDIKPIYDRLDVIKNYLRAKLKQVNEKEKKAEETFKPDHRVDSALGFMRGGEGGDDSEYRSIKAVMNDAKFPPPLSTDITFKDKGQFLNILKQLFKNEDSETLQHIISSASGFISTFDIDSVREFIDKIDSEIDRGKLYSGDLNNHDREKALHLIVGDMMRYILRNFDNTDDNVDLATDYESVVNYAIEQWLPKVSAARSTNDWIPKEMHEESDKPRLGEIPQINAGEVREALLAEFEKGGANIDVLRNLYLGEDVKEENKPAFERQGK